MKETYKSLIVSAILIAVCLGFLGPWLVSAKSTSLVILGFGVVLLVPIGLYRICKRWVATQEGQNIINKIKERI